MSGLKPKLLIEGETRRGKTLLTRIIADLLSAYGGPRGLYIIDFAPNVGGVGSPLTPPPGAKYVRPRGLRAPRLESRGDCRVAWRLALHNASLTSEALLGYLSDPRPALIINDATIHLHAGSPRLMVEALRTSRVAVVNAYMGSRLGDRCGVSERERWALRIIEGEVGWVWRL